MAALNPDSSPPPQPFQPSRGRSRKAHTLQFKARGRNLAKLLRLLEEARQFVYEFDRNNDRVLRFLSSLDDASGELAQKS